MDNTELKQLLKEGSRLLTNKEYDKAKDFFDETLDTYPECAQAYLGLLMSELKVNSFAELEKSSTPIDSFSGFKRAVNFGDDAFQSKLNSILEKNRINIEKALISPRKEQSFLAKENQKNDTQNEIQENNTPNSQNTLPAKPESTQTVSTAEKINNINQLANESENLLPTESPLETTNNQQKQNETKIETQEQPKVSKTKILTALCFIAILCFGYVGFNMSEKDPEINNIAITTETAKISGNVKPSKIDFSKPMEFTIPDVTFCMIPIRNGSFIMGSPDNEPGRESNEKQHKVDIKDSFFIGKFEVTQELFFSVMKENPSRYKGADKPVDSVSWVMAKEFCNKLNNLTTNSRPDNYVFDLPTEAQWEYACRSGKETALYSGKGLTQTEEECANLDEIAWYCFNAMGSTHPVGQKQPNSYGLYDMLGNVSEWCNDQYTESDNNNENIRISRGGNWVKLPSGCRSASRWFAQENDVIISQGFRIALVSK